MVIEIHVVNLVILGTIWVLVGWAVCEVKTVILKDRKRKRDLDDAIKRRVIDPGYDPNYRP